MNKDDNERLSGALQENVLTVLCFDDGACKLVRAAVTVQTFESAVFREVAGHAIDFVDQYGEAIKEHLPDHLDHILRGDDKRKAESYQRLVDNLFAARSAVNTEYVLSQLHKFVRQQNLKSGVIKAVEALEDGRLDDAELELQKALDTQVTVFEPGFNLSDANQVSALLHDPDEEGFDLFIPALDSRGVIPRRKELMGFIAARGKGKSWACTHVAKAALIQGWRPLVISLEMSEKRYAVRFLQNFFSISKRDAEVRVARLQVGKDGRLDDILHEEVTRMTLKDPDIHAKLMRKVRQEFKARPPLRVKSFPSGSLTMPMLRAYLDGLQRHENFTPDVLILDYPMLMELDSSNLRIEIGKINVGLRGLCQERNMAGFIPTQGNRAAEDAAVVTGSMAAEDISFLATVDTCLTYSQTPAEHKLGLARLFAEKARNEESKQTVLITQAYAIGQFCLDSVLLQTSDYWDFMDNRGLIESKRGRGAEPEDETKTRKRR